MHRRDALKLSTLGLLAPGVRVGTASAQQENIRTYRGNYARTGVMPGPAPDPTKPIVAKWVLENDDWALSSPMLADGVVYAGDAQGQMLEVDFATGEPLNTFQTSASKSASPTVIDDRLLIGLAQYNLHDGELIWHQARNDNSDTGSAVADGVMYVGGQGGSVYAFDFDTGDELWSTQLGKDIYLSETVALSEATLYIGNNEGSFYAIATEDGKVLWETELPLSTTATAPKVGVSTAAAVDGAVFVTNKSGVVHSLNAETGEILWNVELPAETHSSPAVVDGSVYVGCQDNHLYALDSTTGDRIWSFDSGGWVQSDPVFADGMVIFGSFNNHVHAIDAETGEEIWKYELDAPVFTSQWVEDGVVLATDGGSKLYAVGNE